MSRRREEQITDPCLVVFVDAGDASCASERRRRGVFAAARAVRGGALRGAGMIRRGVRRGVDAARGPTGRRLRRRLGRLGAVLVAVALAVVPGSLILAAAVLVWHRVSEPRPPNTRAARASNPTSPEAAPAGASATKTPRGAPAPGAAKTTPGAGSPSPAPAKAAAPANAPAPANASALANAPAPKAPSCSAGTRVAGPLLQPARLPERGPGFAQLFPHRNLAYGTDELVGALRRVGAKLTGPNLPPLMVANLSGPKGDQEGQDPFHPATYARSHGAGRAADLAFFLRDTLGRPAPAVETNLAFDAEGRSQAGVRRVYLREGEPAPAGCHPWRTRAGFTESVCPLPEGAFRIDFERTWQLVRALLTDPEIGVVDPATGRARPDGHGVRFVFVTAAHRRRLLEVAERLGEPEPLRRLASILLHPPSNAPPYDSYLHLDLWCTDEDRADCGCDDGGGPWRRWREETQVLARPIEG